MSDVITVVDEIITVTIDNNDVVVNLTDIDPHNLLSSVHTDSLTASVMPGDLIYGNSTPAWARLPKSDDGAVLMLVGGYPTWWVAGVGEDLWTDHTTYISPKNITDSGNTALRIYDAGSPTLQLGTGATFVGPTYFETCGALCASFGSVGVADNSAASLLPTVWIQKEFKSTSANTSPGALEVYLKKSAGSTDTHAIYAHTEYNGGTGSALGIGSWVVTSGTGAKDAWAGWFRVSSGGLDGQQVGIEVNVGGKDFGWSMMTEGYTAGFIASATEGIGSMGFVTGIATQDRYKWHTGLFVFWDSILPNASYWLNSVTYSIGNWVIYSGYNYESLQNGNVNHTPSSSPTYWSQKCTANQGGRIADTNEAFYFGGASTVATSSTGIRMENYIYDAINLEHAAIANYALKFGDGHKIFWGSGACIYGDTAFYISNCNIAIDNNRPIYWKHHTTGVPLCAIYVDTTDTLILGTDQAVTTIVGRAFLDSYLTLDVHNNTSPIAGDLWFYNSHLYFRIGTTSYQIDQQSSPSGYLLIADIDDTPVNNETSAPISSNWAYDHVAAADPHTGYRLESADHTHQSTGAQAGQLDHGLALTGLTDDDHTNYALLAGRAGGQTYIGGTAAYDALTLQSTSNATRGNIVINDDLLLHGHLGMDNSQPIYIKNNAGVLKTMFYMDTSDFLNIGNDLGSGKLRVNIDGTLKVLSIDGSGFVKAT